MIRYDHGMEDNIMYVYRRGSVQIHVIYKDEYKSREVRRRKGKASSAVPGSGSLKI